MKMSLRNAIVVALFVSVASFAMAAPGTVALRSLRFRICLH
jgi:hypothetical protein